MHAPLSADLTALDTESRWWLEPLHADGQAHEEAIVRLHGLLRHAAQFEAARRRGSLPQLDRGELEDLALQSAAWRMWAEDLARCSRHPSALAGVLARM